MSEWEEYDKVFYPFPKEDDVDTFYRAEKPTKDMSSKLNKLLLQTDSRIVSIFESQLRPIAHYFVTHPDEKQITVIWKSKEGRIFPMLQEAMNKKR